MAKTKDEQYYQRVHELTQEIALATASLDGDGVDHPEWTARTARVNAAVDALREYTSQYSEPGGAEISAGPVRVLILEDNAADAELMVRALKKAGFDVQSDLVQSESDFAAGLKTNPNLVLSDNALPHFGSREALALLRASGHNVPFIVVSGQNQPEAFAELVSAGADDYVLKEDIEELGEVVSRALKKKRH